MTVAMLTIQGIKMEFREITKLADKLTWLTRFEKSYSGGYRAKDAAVIPSKYSRLFMAMENVKEMGFIRISDNSHWGEGYENVWGVSDVYVKPAYRHQGVLRQMIVFAQENHNARTIFMESSRFLENISYYHSLGFGCHRGWYGDGDLAYFFDKTLVKNVLSKNPANLKGTLMISTANDDVYECALKYA